MPVVVPVARPEHERGHGNVTKPAVVVVDSLDDRHGRCARVRARAAQLERARADVDRLGREAEQRVPGNRRGVDMKLRRFAIASSGRRSAPLAADLEETKSTIAPTSATPISGFRRTTPPSGVDNGVNLAAMAHTLLPERGRGHPSSLVCSGQARAGSIPDVHLFRKPPCKYRLLLP